MTDQERVEKLACAAHTMNCECGDFVAPFGHELDYQEWAVVFLAAIDADPETYGYRKLPKPSTPESVAADLTAAMGHLNRLRAP